MPGDNRHRVFLDPDGKWPKPWFFVIVRASTGVIYEQMHIGIGAIDKEIEGYLVPIGRPQDKKIDSLEKLWNELANVFFIQTEMIDFTSRPIPPDRVEYLGNLIGIIPFVLGLGSFRSYLSLDDSKLGEIVETRIPVLTPVGPGILVWNNWYNNDVTVGMAGHDDIL